jgi:cardiolipin synthase A/B
VRIWVYADFVYHAKSATIAGVCSFVGSANVDSPRLHALNETAFEGYFEHFAARIEETSVLEKIYASELTLQEWESRPSPGKLLEWDNTPLRTFG